MDFLDNSGHIFSLPSYREEPIGHEFEENDYIFWIDSVDSNKLSINNYYSRTINIVVPYDEIEGKSFSDIVDINISIDSKKFWLLRPIDIQEIINDNKSVKDYIDLQKFLVTKDQDEPGYIYNNQILTNDDLYVFTISQYDEEIFNETGHNINWPTDHLAIIPLYIISTSEEEGTWISNILIHIKDKEDEYGISYSAILNEDWCSISVGAEYIDENEILTINGTNMGINLPKDLFRSIYQVSFQNDVFDEAIYNDKIKEYLVNYMSIRGEIGNYKSAIASLNWFGYGDKIQLTKLIKTDNQLKDQYINDSFTITTDILKSFRYFRNSTLLSLKLKENQETSIENPIEIENDFWGEGKPVMEDLFNKQVEELVGYEEDQWSYWKPYYEYSLYEMGLKISCLKYYYETYFLPIHLKVHSASIVHKVYSNDIKYNNHVYNTNRTEESILMGHTRQVYFDTNNVRYFTNQLHYVDDQFNEFNGFDPTIDDIYKISDTCLNVPIRFINNKDEEGNELPTYFTCTLLLEKEKKDNEYFLPYRLNIFRPFNIFYYDLFIYEQNFNNKLDLDKYNYAYSFLYQNDYSNWYSGYDNFKNQLKEIFKIQLNTNYNDSIDNTYNLVCIYTNNQNEENNTNINNNISLKILWNEDVIRNIFNTEDLGDIDTISQYGNNYKTIESILKEKFKDKDNNDIYNINELINQLKDIQPLSTPYILNTTEWYVYIPSIDDFEINPMHIEDIIGNIVIIPKMNFKIKFDDTEINDIFLQQIDNKNIKLQLKENIKINYVIENSLVYESHFSFVQLPNKQSTYYNCFVLYPKILNKININYFVDQKFKIKLLVNNQWYFYEFTSKMPDLNLQFGKLKYKYWTTTDNYYSSFSQLKDITPNNIVFNSFMHEPEIVMVDHINYYEDILKYIELNNIRYIDDSNHDIKIDNFNKYISIESQIPYNEDYIKKEFKIYFHKSFTIGLDELDTFFVNSDYFDRHSLRIIDKDLMFSEISYMNDNSEDFKYFEVVNNISTDAQSIIKEYENYLLNNDSEECIIENIINSNSIPEIGEDLVNELNKTIYFTKDTLSKSNHNIVYNLNSYEIIELNGNHIIKPKISKKLKVYENIVSDIKKIYQKYDFKLNINKNNYLNNIHIFDIYEPYSSSISVDMFDDLGNVRINCNGINFLHSVGDPKIYLEGKSLFKEDIDSRFVDLYGFYFHNWSKDNGETSLEHDTRVSGLVDPQSGLNYHKLEQYINDQFKIRYYYYVDNNNIPSNSSTIHVNKSVFICKLIIDTLSGLKDISKYGIVDYFDISDDYKNIFNGFNYIMTNNNPKIIFISKDNYSNNKKIFIKVSYINYIDNDNYSLLDSISNNEALQIANNIKIDNIRILIEFYEYIDQNIDNKLVQYLDEPEGVEGNKYFYYYGNKINLIEQRYNRYIDERNYCKIPYNENGEILPINEIENNDNIIYKDLGEIPVDELVGTQEFLGNPAFRFLKFKVAYKIEDGEPIVVINEEDKVVINKLNTMTLYRNKFDSLTDYIDYINKNPEIIKENNENVYKKINDIYTYWNENLLTVDLTDVESYNDKINELKTLLENNKTNEVNPYINLRNYLVQKEFTFEDIHKKMKLKEIDQEFELDWETSDERISIILDIIHPNGGIEKINYKGERFTLKEHDICKMYVYIKNEDNQNIIITPENIENSVFIRPYLKVIEYGYQKLEYKYNEQNATSIWLDNIEYKYGNNKSQEVVNLYNEFFEVDYLPDLRILRKLNSKNPESQIEGLNLETYNNSLTGVVYEVEKIYEIENKYLIWKNSNILSSYIYDEESNIPNNCILVIGSNKYNTYQYIYNKLNGKNISFYDYSGEFIIYDNTNFNDIDSSNLLNMIKFDFSIKNKVDFYDVKIYSLFDGDRFEVKPNESYLLDNYVKVIKSKVNLKKYLDYDFYLMHDFKYWYGVFISKQIINRALSKNQLMISDDNKVMKPSYKDRNGKLSNIVYKKVNGEIKEVETEGFRGYNEYNNVYFNNFDINRYNIKIGIEKSLNYNELLNNIFNIYQIIINEFLVFTYNGENNELIIKDDDTLYFYIEYVMDNENKDIYYSSFIPYNQLISIANVDINEFMSIMNIHNDILYAESINIIFSSYNFNNSLFDNVVNQINHINDNDSFDIIKNVIYVKDEYKYQEYEDVDFEYENNTKYILKYVNTGNEFLINRMQFIPNNGVNHFNKKDMIVGKVTNNPQLPVNIFNGSKWNIHPISVGHSEDIKIESNSEMCLLSFPSNNNEYERGYYDVDLRYSLDGNTQQQYFKKGKIRID